MWPGACNPGPGLAFTYTDSGQKNGNINVKSLNRALGHYGIPLCGVLGRPVLMKLAACAPG
ncbi:UNVERIFIED_CONTAM: hypothetical protein FKN15_043641 [Acipenser sinensis]